ncbi:MAG: ADP-ribosylglycohydrolase family protein [Aureliella sp.]
MHSTHLRRAHIHGALAGAAVGDALGFPRDGLSRRAARKMYGSPTLRFQSVGSGVYTSDTHLMLMTAQALLNSRSDLKSFRRAFRSRMKWYLLSLPYCAASTYTSAAKCWIARFGVSTATSLDNNQVGATAIFSTLAMNRTGHRLEKWVDDTVRITNSNASVGAGCRVLCAITDFVAAAKGEDLDHDKILDLAIEAADMSELQSKLGQLKEHLKKKDEPAKVADAFGWQHGVGSSMVPTVVMAVYCWLRDPGNFEKAVLPAIALGGDCSSIGAITGGLVGAYRGFDGIPSELYNRLGGTPHGPEWISALAERFSRWPHGEHDLHMAPAQNSDPPMQLVRNFSTLCRIGMNRLARWPRRAGNRS